MTTTYVQIGGQLLEGNLAPQDRTFRNAWSYTGQAIEVDMTAAKEIQKDRIRQDRKEEFLNADAAWFLADEQANSTKKAEIAARKKKLRDAPEHPSITNAATPDELKQVTLEKIIKG